MVSEKYQRERTSKTSLLISFSCGQNLFFFDELKTCSYSKLIVFWQIITAAILVWKLTAVASGQSVAIMKLLLQLSNKQKN